VDLLFHKAKIDELKGKHLFHLIYLIISEEQQILSKFIKPQTYLELSESWKIMLAKDIIYNSGKFLLF
jgi:hypothetical protein